MKKLLFTLLLSGSAITSFCQTIPYKFGEIAVDDLELKSYRQDTSANAIILNEFGESHIDDEHPDVLMFRYYGKIKIFNQKGQSAATITIPLYRNKGAQEDIFYLEAYTYNFEHGQIVKTKLASKEQFTERLSEKYELVKFTFPMVKPGSVLEYKYTIRTPFYFYNFKEWAFQKEIPVVHSEYWARIPGYFTYNVTLRGLQKLKSQSTTLLKDCFDPPGPAKSDCTFIKLSMDHVPAIKEEEYMTTIRNYQARVEFELEEFININTGAKEKITKTWKNVEQQLFREPRFASYFQKNQKFYKKTYQQLNITAADSLDNVKQLYAYFQRYFTWNEKNGVLTDSDPEDIWSRKTGSVSELNLFLVGMLRSMGYSAEPVILSTRNNGIPNSLYPVLTDFNYTIARVTIGNNVYLLDISEKRAAFGELPFRCFNDRGRIIDYEKSDWLMLTPSYYDTFQVRSNIELDKTGKIKSHQAVSLKYDYALNARKKIAGYSSKEDYQKSLQSQFSNGTISNVEIDNLDNTNESLNINYDFEIEAEDEKPSKTIYLNPYFFERTTSNPFKQNIRSFPVDFGLKKSWSFIINVKLPDNYEIETLPNDVNFVLPGRIGSYIGKFEKISDGIVMQGMLKLDKEIYPFEYYAAIKELFDLMIKKQNEPIVLRLKEPLTQKSK
ncbi:DUF3857 domain-containing protein [Solitalea sp. MAHUQ-68]|uniref:DUF3857 domain-containing protein n=1 Tax=Solitalea agri TaxID=2953739 RepID=A0A9X2EZH4_9SPHI|nr:DUF3857 domain-containing protein [Solitalea agri]MCO4291807.1 DUF3857 domain-containing protein [Solitalea agri]